MPRPDVALGDRHDQPQVGLDQRALGVVAVVGQAPAGARASPAGEVAQRARGVEVGELLGRLGAGLDALGQLHLLGRDEQRHAADLAQVHAHRVGRAARPAPGARSAFMRRAAAQGGRQAPQARAALVVVCSA